VAGPSPRFYQDRASGAKEKHPGLYALMTDARRGQFDVVIVWTFDRFAWSGKQLVLALEEFRALNIDFVSHQEALDTLDAHTKGHAYDYRGYGGNSNAL
jgi:DNA invertase Pin-like site-specific DNA recombinase